MMSLPRAAIARQAPDRRANSGGVGWAGAFGNLGDLLQTVMLERELDRRRVQAEAIAEEQRQIENRQKDRSIGVDEGNLGVRRDEHGLNVRKWDDAAPDRASVLRARDASTSQQLQTTAFERDDRQTSRDIIGRLPGEGPEPGLMSPRDLALLSATGGPNLANAEGRRALYGPRRVGEMTGAEELSGWRGGQREVARDEADIETDAGIRRDRAKIAAEAAAAGGGQSSVADEYMDERAFRTLSAVDDLNTMVGENTTGLGSLLAYIPRTQARDFEAKLKELKANIAFGELTAMRAASKTGGALGAVSERELALLESTLGALDSAQSPGAFRGNLKKIKDSIERWQSASRGARGVRTDTAGARAGGAGERRVLEWRPDAPWWESDGPGRESSPRVTIRRRR